MGVDPGTTIGLAILDLRGRLLHLSSKRGADNRWILQTIAEYGIPVVIATDVAPPPERVVKIAASFGAKLWVPSEPLSVEYKERVAKAFSYKNNEPSNDHERDALAAAFASFTHFSSKFRQVERRLRNLGKLEQEDYVKRLVVLGRSVDQALRLLAGRPKYENEGGQKRRARVEEKQRTRSSVSRGEVAELRERLKLARAEIEHLRMKCSELESALRKIRSEREKEIRRDAIVARLRREKEHLLSMVREREKQLDRARQDVEKLAALLRGLADGKYVLYPLQDAKRLGLNIVYSVSPKIVIVEKRELENKDPDAFKKKLERMLDEYRRERTYRADEI